MVARPDFKSSAAAVAVAVVPPDPRPCMSRDPSSPQSPHGAAGPLGLPLATRRICVHDHSEAHPTPPADQQQLVNLLHLALPQVLAARGTGQAPLPSLAEIEISLLDDPALAAVHRDFLNDPAPTDVITFHHGEILISTETAVREAAQRGDLPLREITLYAIHGLLHLHGHNDAEAADRAIMHATQDRILQSVWPRPAIA
ncbi:MAG: rRNA maturation RNase YbeY [Verrucomicrobiales bacterium]